jgi:hypothetical protein
MNEEPRTPAETLRKRAWANFTHARGYYDMAQRCFATDPARHAERRAKADVLLMIALDECDEATRLDALPPPELSDADKIAAFHAVDQALIEHCTEDTSAAVVFATMAKNLAVSGLAIVRVKP